MPAGARRRPETFRFPQSFPCSIPVFSACSGTVCHPRAGMCFHPFRNRFLSGAERVFVRFRTVSVPSETVLPGGDKPAFSRYCDIYVTIAIKVSLRTPVNAEICCSEIRCSLKNQPFILPFLCNFPMPRQNRSSFCPQGSGLHSR